MSFNRIDLGMNVQLEVIDTDYAKSFQIFNDETKRAIDLGMRLK